MVDRAMESSDSSAGSPVLRLCCLSIPTKVAGRTITGKEEQVPVAVLCEQEEGSQGIYNCFSPHSIERAMKSSDSSVSSPVLCVVSLFPKNYP